MEFSLGTLTESKESVAALSFFFTLIVHVIGKVFWLVIRLLLLGFPIEKLYPSFTKSTVRILHPTKIPVLYGCCHFNQF
jgi:hypothetical protein